MDGRRRMVASDRQGTRHGQGSRYTQQFLAPPVSGRGRNAVRVRVHAPAHR
jgi:hypothetical protein